MNYDLNITSQSLIRETEKAMLVFDGHREIWLPKKMVTWQDRGACFLPTIAVPLWFAKRNGLIATGRDVA